jgi:hypothetical protein
VWIIACLVFLIVAGVSAARIHSASKDEWIVTELSDPPAPLSSDASPYLAHVAGSRAAR